MAVGDKELTLIVADPSFLQLVYSGYSCTQGWFFTPCTSDPGLRLISPN